MQLQLITFIAVGVKYISCCFSLALCGVHSTWKPVTKTNDKRRGILENAGIFSRKGHFIAGGLVLTRELNPNHVSQSQERKQACYLGARKFRGAIRGLELAMQFKTGSYVGLYVYIKAAPKGRFGWDDWSTYACLVSLDIFLSHHGTRRHYTSCQVFGAVESTICQCPSPYFKLKEQRAFPGWSTGLLVSSRDISCRLNHRLWHCPAQMGGAVCPNWQIKYRSHKRIAESIAYI